TPSEKVQQGTEKTSWTKGPQVSGKIGASAVTESGKSKHQQRNQQPVNKIKESDEVTVYFHAVLSKDFKVDPETHKVFIRAEGISSSAGMKDICELT
ncbi:E3 ubiquitin-protein ligase RNF213, partial [Calypte anna]